jgi:PBP1b-binding outer membrane lipoprotein LpoB
MKKIVLMVFIMGVFFVGCSVENTEAKHYERSNAVSEKALNQLDRE